jgi:nucleotide-binding universal stress UspA family protein
VELAFAPDDRSNAQINSHRSPIHNHLERAMTRPVTRILVPSDFSEPADAALRYAATLAGDLGASLHLLHVFEDPYPAGGAFTAELYVPVAPDLRDQLFEEAQARLRDRVAALAEDQVEATAEIYSGPTAKAIADYATTEDIDLIVIGTHGRGGMAHLLLGSVAERVVRTAPCPVLTIRPGAVAVPVNSVAA